VWVKIPTLSATQDTEIFIYYGNCLGTGLPNLFNTNTWNNDSNSDDYAAVWLMNDTAPTTVVDATANSLDGTGNGLAASTAGQIDGAIDLEAGDANDNFTYSSYTSSGSALTISAWINPESLAGGVGDDAIILSHSDFELKTIVADLAVDENELSFEVTTSGAVSVESLPSDLAAGSFMMVTGVYDGSNVTIYENGNPIASAAQTGTLSGTNSDILIGNNAADGLPFDGLIDHVTILPAARSADWVKTMYNNQSDPGSFYTYASANEESQVAWVGGASGAETDFNNANNWSNCVVPANTESIILESGLSNYPVLTQNTQVVDLIIESGATFGLGGFELTVTGRLTNNGTFTHSNGKVTFAGSAEQQLSGSSATTLYDVEVNNPGNEVRIETTTTIENTVTLTSGFITISDNPLTLTSTGEISGGSATSFFITEGAQCLEQENIGATGRTGNILFPLGISSAEYTPITINNAGTDDDFCVRVADNVYSGGNIGSGTQLTSRMIDKTWFVDEAVIGGSNATLTIQWNVGDELVDFDRTDMFIRHYTSSWVQYESGITASNPGANVYSASTAGVTSFSPVGGGSGDGPLPIELLSFSVTAQDSHVNIKWSTATETNNDYFSLYQSTDGISFSEIGRISGAGNSSQLLNYAWKDLNPSTGINYYYLRQTDFDGAFENFDIKSATIERSDVVDLALTIYPNPASGTFHLIGSGFGSDQEVLVSISDMTGKVIFSKIENSEVDGTLQVQHSLRKSSGIYFINMESFGRKIQKKLILRN
ncbi:MAG: LamG-like jellyroll fold domain-containing protein, partial [Cyclobacteriaceae bacterium]